MYYVYEEGLLQALLLLAHAQPPPLTASLHRPLTSLALVSHLVLQQLHLCDEVAVLLLFLLPHASGDEDDGHNPHHAAQEDDHHRGHHCWDDDSERDTGGGIIQQSVVQNLEQVRANGDLWQ